MKNYANQITALVALLVLVAGYLLAPDAKLDRLAHVLTTLGATTGGQMIYAALVTLVIAGLRAALAYIPRGKAPPGGGVVLLLALCLGASVVSGCGAGALATQARAATIVGVGLGSIGQELHDERATALDACEADAVPLHCESERTSAWAPAVAAYESARAALSTWIEALDVARQAGEPDGDLLGALFVAVSRLARQWDALAAALRGVGVDVPDLPPVVAGLLGAGAAS